MIERSGWEPMSAVRAEDVGAFAKAYPKHHPSRKDEPESQYLEEYVGP